MCVPELLGARQHEFALHRQQVWAALCPERVKMGIYPKRDGEGRVASGTSSAGLVGGLGRWKFLISPKFQLFLLLA